MLKVTKLSILVLTVAVFFALGAVALAQETATSAQATTSDVNQELNLDENVTPQDLGVPSPTLLPDNPFYFFKNWRILKKI